MMHSQQRSNKVLTEEQRKTNDELSQRINAMIKQFIIVRHTPIQQQTSIIADPLAFTTLLSQMCPDLYSIYNYRRELIIDKFQLLETKQEMLKFIAEELNYLNQLLKQMSKSYSIWHHRKWIIQKGIEIEHSINIPYQDSILQMELFLCGKMLQKDERNFHAWNYRHWVLSIDKTNYKDAIKQELLFTKQKIEHNFSNFSALHFRSKALLAEYKIMQQEKWVMMNQQHQSQQQIEPQQEIELQQEIQSQLQIKQNLQLSMESFFEVFCLQLPFHVIVQELDMIQAGLYIEPNEQGIWQYHRWLLELMVPIKVEGITCFAQNKNVIVIVGFNDSVSGLNDMNVCVRQESSNEIVPISLHKCQNGKYSQIWVISFKEQPECETLSIHFSSAHNMITKYLMEQQEEGEQTQKMITLEQMQSQFISNQNGNRNFLASTFKIQKVDDSIKCKRGWQMQNIKHTDKHQQIEWFPENTQINEQIKEIIKREEDMVRDLIELEPKNRFLLLQQNFENWMRIYSRGNLFDTQLIQVLLQNNVQKLERCKSIFKRQEIMFNEQIIDLVKIINMLSQEFQFATVQTLKECDETEQQSIIYRIYFLNKLNENGSLENHAEFFNRLSL